MGWGLPDITLSTTAADEAAGDISMVITCEAPSHFPARCTVVINALEGIVPDAQTGRTISVTIPNTARADGDYAIQVRSEDGRISPPATLTINAVEP